MHRLILTNEKSHDEVVKRANASCIRCGRCCRDLGSIELIWKDLMKLCKHKNKTTTELVKKYGITKHGKAWWIPHPCPFLKELNQCTVYAVRPRVCRWFPMKLFLMRQNDPRVHNWISICDALRLTLDPFSSNRTVIDNA